MKLGLPDLGQSVPRSADDLQHVQVSTPKTCSLDEQVMLDGKAPQPMVHRIRLETHIDDAVAKRLFPRQGEGLALSPRRRKPHKHSTWETGLRGPEPLGN